MKLTGIHLLLTYSCNLECDHCFVWGSPWQEGTMTLATVREIVRQARDLGTVEWIYFEGGEPFLYYPLLLRGVELAAAHGFEVGIVSNGYWATEVEDATEWLRPMKGLVQDLSLSRDPYHGDALYAGHADNARAAAETLGIPGGVISIARPESVNAASVVGQLPCGESALRYRGRAAEKLSPRADQDAWTEFTTCPCEDLRDPGRVHVDPYGHVHLCQGIRIGSIFGTPLSEICRNFDPDADPIVGPLLRGGPAQLAREHDLEPVDHYADACHLCCEARSALRPRFPELLGPRQMYGVSVGASR